MDWIPPELREDTGEIEAAVSHNLPKLVEMPDIKGDLHIHSSFPIEPSHDLGRNSIGEMIEKALELDYSYVAISEHNPSISKHTKKNMIELIQKRNEEIDKVQKKHKSIKIFKSMEVDILPDGSLALDEDCLSLLDFAVVSVHSVFKMDKEQMTKRVLNGLSHQKAKILGHPTGRLLTGRAGYELSFSEIFEFCKRHNKALEINAWPNRLDLPDTLIKEAVEFGVLLVIDTDSHAASQMGLMEYGVSMARRGWATKKNIINTMILDEMQKWVDN
jgi:DNA polymerase (family 10)